MGLLQAVIDGVIAGLQTAVEEWLAHAWSVMTGLAWVALGSALGGIARFFVSGVVGKAIGETFPWGTMVVNVTGAFAVGMAAAFAGVHTGLESHASWHFAVVGALGSYTTVSSFSLQTLALARDGERLGAGANVFMSLVLCLSAVALGFASGVAATGRGTW